MVANDWKVRNIRLSSILGSILFGVMLPSVAFAEQSGGWRPTYDLIMLWVNFLILAFVLIKYLRQPIADFLLGKRMELSRDMDRIESQRQAVSEKLRETVAELEKSEARFEEIKARILAQGQAQRDRIIEDARNQGQHIMEMAKRKMEGRILAVRKQFQADLVDQAITLALERLPKHMTPEDHDKVVEQFMAQT